MTKRALVGMLACVQLLNSQYRPASSMNSVCVHVCFIRDRKIIMISMAVVFKIALIFNFVTNKVVHTHCWSKTVKMHHCWHNPRSMARACESPKMFHLPLFKEWVSATGVWPAQVQWQQLTSRINRKRQWCFEGGTNNNEITCVLHANPLWGLCTQKSPCTTLEFHDYRLGNLCSKLSQKLYAQFCTWEKCGNKQSGC